MKKSILIPMNPRFCARIMNDDKTIDIRKSKVLYKAIQKLINENGYASIYVYCTKDTNLLHKNCADIYWVEDKDFKKKTKQLGLPTQPILNGKVLFKFRCYKVEEWDIWQKDLEEKLKLACLSIKEFDDYSTGQVAYAIRINDLEIFDEPRELSEFYKSNEQLEDIYWTWNNYGVPDRDDYDEVILRKAPQNFCYVEWSREKQEIIKDGNFLIIKR